MARTALAPIALVPNGTLAQPAGTAGNVDGHSITGVLPELLVLRVVVATATTTVTVKAGARPPALESTAQVAALAVGTHLLGPFTSGRVVQADGSVHVDYAVAANVTVTALSVPRNT